MIPTHSSYAENPAPGNIPTVHPSFGCYHSDARMVQDQGERMWRTLLTATLIVLVVIASGLTSGQKDIVGVMPAQVRWFTPTYYTDGRQRAQLYGDSNQGGPWIDRVKIPAGRHVAAHTHPQDELSYGNRRYLVCRRGGRHDPAKLEGCTAGAFVRFRLASLIVAANEADRHCPAKRRRKISHRLCREVEARSEHPCT